MPSVGLLVVGSQVGSARCTFRCLGGSRTMWAWSEGSPPVRELEPVRRTKSGQLSRNVPVQAVSMTTKGWLYLESGLEHELATWLDRMPGVVWLLGQPVMLEWADGVRHYPTCWPDSPGKRADMDAQASLFGEPARDQMKPARTDDLEVLITVKAAPNPSAKTGETVCAPGLALSNARWGTPARARSGGCMTSTGAAVVCLE